MNGGLLISSPQIGDPNFERAVVLLCQHNDEGSIGLVINRAGPVSLGEVADRMELGAPLTPAAPTWWGGPVGPGRGFVVWQDEEEIADGWTLPEGVRVSPALDRLRDLVETNHPFHLALGYAGWGPGQLEEEIEGGGWLFIEVLSEILFETPLDLRYDRALAELGLTRQGLWLQPGDA